MSATVERPYRAINRAPTGEFAFCATLALRFVGALGGLPGQAVDLGAELVEILEAAIDGGEADIGDLVEALQGLHHLLADDPGVNLPLAPAAPGLANALHRGLNGLGADRALLQGAKHAGAQLLLVEGLPGAVTLDDSRHHQPRGLVGGVALAAGNALAAPPHLVALGDQPRVGDLGVMGSAEGAVRSEERRVGKGSRCGGG